MFSAPRISARTLVATSSRPVARRVGGARLTQRFQSSNVGGSTSTSSSSVGTHVAAGLAGGGAVLLGAYAYYHFSGAKRAVDTAKSASEYLQQTKASIQENAPKSPNEALEMLRNMVKSYAGVIPGASAYVDTTFDALDEMRESHGEDVNRILNDTYQEISSLVKDSQTVDIATGMKVMEVWRRRTGELNEIAQKAGKNLYGAFEQKHPEAAKFFGSRLNELRELAERSGPEAKKVFDDTAEQVRRIMAKGPSPEALNEARELVQSKASQIREVAQKSSQQAWDKALQQASPYLDKVPEIKELISQNASKFVAAGAASLGSSKGEAEEVFEKVKEVAEEAGKDGKVKDKQKIEELKQFVQRKAEEASQKANAQFVQSWETLQEWIRSVPGGDEALQKIPEFGAFSELAKNRGEDAKNLAKETYDDIVKLLQEKSKKASKLAEEAKEETKENSGPQ
ncbi:hypothetical protein K474DRAFT_1655985 [Panus rudis PR-1116 ss-1]|nr:hypothetical protein K474DRAFT_1655985 [Panus rudis PR-1116 ss-1]